MKRENKLLLAFGAIVLVPVFVIWFVAWPLLHLWEFPDIASARRLVPSEQILAADDVRAINHWLHHHNSGWGPRGERPPREGDTVLELETAQGRHLIVSVWRYRHAPAVIGIQTEPKGPYRMHSFSERDLTLFFPSKTDRSP